MFSNKELILQELRKFNSYKINFVLKKNAEKNLSHYELKRELLKNNPFLKKNDWVFDKINSVLKKNFCW